MHRKPALKHAGVRLPRSQTTIWKLLRQAGCMAVDRRRKPRPFDLPEPGEEVQFDLKDESLVPADPEGKRPQVVEMANFVDAGTSSCLQRAVRSDFDAQARLEVVAPFCCQQGLPGMLTFANDPRLVGSPSGRDFPCALVRLRLGLGVQPSAHPPSSTRFESLGRAISSLECLRNGGLVHRPAPLSEVCELIQASLSHSNQQRPKQARWLTQPTAAGGLPLSP